MLCCAFLDWHSRHRSTGRSFKHALFCMYCLSSLFFFTRCSLPTACCSDVAFLPAAENAKQFSVSTFHKITATGCHRKSGTCTNCIKYLLNRSFIHVDPQGMLYFTKRTQLLSFWTFLIFMHPVPCQPQCRNYNFIVKYEYLLNASCMMPQGIFKFLISTELQIFFTRAFLKDLHKYDS